MERDVDASVKDLTDKKIRFAELCNDPKNASSPAVEKLYQDMQGNLQQLDWDCEDLHSAVQAALDHPEKYSLSTSELVRRQDFVQEMARKATKLRDDVERIEVERRKKMNAKRVGAGGAGGRVEYDEAAVAATNDNLRTAMETQAQLKVEEEALMERLSMGVKSIKNKAEVIGGELKDQERMLDELDKDVSVLSLKVEAAAKKVNHLIENSSDSKKMICIGVLLVILMLLIFFLFSN
jgi:t-SNARE complex subunit (syntaxin)